ncbi:sensor histidine kinase [Longispora albida]|uniref:sensor histidine kinase n=1 Tax=Longispora albida TaxID=203523 RepID=UPI0003602180|nr:ATP-binding protein [Longispora albida]
MHLRTRLVLIAATGLAVVLAIGGLILVLVLRIALLHSLETSANQTARDTAQLVLAGELPDPIPSGGSAVVQVLDSEGRILAASMGADRLVPVLNGDLAAQARSGRAVYRESAPTGIDGPVIVAGAAAGEQTVLVVVSARDTEDILRALGASLLVAFPVLLAAMVAVGWVVIGRALRPAEEARTRQRIFVADAAHELRSPIASLRTQLEVAVHLDDPADPAELLADVERLGRLADDLLLLARVEGEAPAKRVPVNVAALLGLDGEHWVLGDEHELRRVFENLAGNARLHAGSEPDIAIGRDGPDVLVTVTDHGPGIPAADRERVFARFTRLDASRAGTGTGLGLAIVRELVTAHGGTVRLADAAPGLRAEVRLPRARATPATGR